MDETRSSGDAGPYADQPVDAALAARLEKLAVRRAQSAPSASAGGRTPTRRARSHPARGARLAALGLSLATTGGLTFLFSAGGASAGVPTTSAQVVSLAGVTPPSTSAATASTASASTFTPSTSAPASADPIGSANSDLALVDGAVYSNRWGDVQVQAQFADDGSLADVVVLESPFADGKSVRINERAVPALNAEALSTQSAQVDTVSGATYTSADYRRSLQSAIDAARAAGLTQLQ